MRVDINLQFYDNGYGIKHFAQTAPLGDETVTFIVRGLAESEGMRANEIVTRVWDWAQKNMENIKHYLSAELAKEFEDMRKKKEKNVPPDNAAAIQAQLAEKNISDITCYPGQSSFELGFPGHFNGYDYALYVSVNDDFTFKNAGILTMGGFKPPKDEATPDLKKAATLYDYHIRHGSEAGLYKHYIALPAKEIDVFADMLIADQETDEDELTELMLYLALYSYACGEKLPDRLYRHLIDSEIFYFGEIYLRADEKFADDLIKTLDEVDDPEEYRTVVNHILCALAMIPCKRVNDFLLENSRDPLPIWAQNLYILPKEYAKVGGWEAVENGLPNMLFSEDVTAFERCKKKEASPLVPAAPLAENCGLCGQPLTLAFDGEYKLATCLHCACYQTVFTKVDADGVCWHKSNAPGDFFQKYPDYMKNNENIAARFEYGLRPSGEVRRATYTANEFAYITRTQLGGMPTAINDMDYPTCPDCGKTMRFAAQFDMADIDDGEGLFYFFVCNDCGVCGANYGQS